MRPMASACSSMPPTISPLRPIRSDKAPVPIWAIPQTAGYTATSTPISATPRPCDAKNSGSSPQAIPSLRLLTRPACDAADRDGSPIVVRPNTVRHGSGRRVRMLEGHVPARLAHEQDRDAQAHARDRQAEEERLGPKTGLGGDIARGEGGQGDRDVARRLVQPQRQAASSRPDEVHLHDHGARPGQTLVDPEQARSRRAPSPTPAPRSAAAGPARRRAIPPPGPACDRSGRPGRRRRGWRPPW